MCQTRSICNHKQALALVRDNQVIHLEDLNIAGMVRNHRSARVINDAGWAQFVRVITEKAERYGRTVYRVSGWLASSKTCSTSGCGHVIDELPLHLREWTCPICRTVHDRDYNAARVVLAAGRAERQNASHIRGRDCFSSSGGASVSPPAEEAQSGETGSAPTAA